MTQPYETLDDVVNRLAELEARYAARRDRRVVFLTVYGLMSREMKRRIGLGDFHDNEWVTRYTVAFANLYREAHDKYVDRDRDVPRAWTIAFDTAGHGSALISQDLLLGINAHVNHDLALALDRVSIDPNRDAREQDHTAVNEVLRATSDAVSDQVSELYARGLAGVDVLAGTFDEKVSNFSLTVARARAWDAAVALAGARSGVERRAIGRELDLQSSARALLILAPNLSPALMEACRQVESGAWWDVLQAAVGSERFPR